ncbi:MAG: WD40 repeat domain-containing protein [Planctomycetes bacterium]|nr:WD40 repeat domain-containing protein [Planctomycetota bacterium]
MRWHRWLVLLCVLAGATVTTAQERLTLPPGAVARLGASPLRVPEGIIDSAFSTDRRTLVIIFHGAKDQCNLVLFDVSTGLERKRLNVRQAQRLALARQKPWMVVDTPAGFEVWNLATEKLVRKWPHPAPGWRTTGLTISPDGTEVVAAVTQRDTATILRWDAATGKSLPARYSTHSQICALRFSDDGVRLLTASEDRVVLVKDKYETIPGSIIAWETRTGRKLAELPTVYPNVRFSPDGTRFARGTTGKSVEIIEIGTGKRLAEFAEPHGQFAFMPDSNRLLLLSGGQIRLWDIAARKDVRPFEDASGAFIARECFSADGRLLAVIQSDWHATYAQFWDVATGKRLRFPTSHPGLVGGLTYLPDGRRLATFSESTLLISDATTGQILHRWVGHKKTISQIAFSPDGKLLASASIDGTIVLWDPATAKERRRLTPNGTVRMLAFTRDGAALIAVNDNRTTQIWDVQNGVLQRNYEVPQRMAAPSLSSNGRVFAWFASYPFSTLRLMNAQTGKGLPSVDLRRDGEIERGLTYPALAFSADGKLFATSDSQKIHDHAVRVWETATRKEIFRVAGIHNSTRLLAISPDGRILAHGFHAAFTWGGHGADAAVTLRDMSSGQSLSLKATRATLEEKKKWPPPITGHHGRITCLAFSPDSKFIATGGSDQVVYIWRVEDFFKRPDLREIKGDVAALWRKLAEADAGKAYQAMAHLERKPTETLALLRKHLQPVPTADGKIIAQQLRNLASANFAIRQQAAVALEKSGQQAAHLLQEALKSPANLEVKRRLEMLLEKLEQSLEEPGQLRAYRCLVLLERIGTPEARKLLIELSQGAPAARLTIEACESLKRCLRR